MRGLLVAALVLSMGCKKDDDKDEDKPEPDAIALMGAEETTEFSGFVYYSSFWSEGLVLMLVPWQGASCKGSYTDSWLGIDDTHDGDHYVAIALTGPDAGEGDIWLYTHPGEAETVDFFDATVTDLVGDEEAKGETVSGSVSFSSDQSHGTVTFEYEHCGTES